MTAALRPTSGTTLSEMERGRDVIIAAAARRRRTRITAMSRSAVIYREIPPRCGTGVTKPSASGRLHLSPGRLQGLPLLNDSEHQGEERCDTREAVFAAIWFRTPTRSLSTG